MRYLVLLLAGCLLLLWLTDVGTAQSVESPKAHSGAILEGGAAQSPKAHSGAIMEIGSENAPKVHSGAVLETPSGLQSPKMHGFAVIENTGISSPKMHGFAVLEPAGLQSPKMHGFSVLEEIVGNAASKLVGNASLLNNTMDASKFLPTADLFRTELEASKFDVSANIGMCLLVAKFSVSAVLVTGGGAFVPPRIFSPAIEKLFAKAIREFQPFPPAYSQWWPWWSNPRASPLINTCP